MDPAQAAEGERSPSLGVAEPQLDKVPGWCWQGLVLGGRQDIIPTVFCLWAVSLCFFVAQTGAQPLPFHMKHARVAELACHAACSHELGCAPRLAQAHLCCCTLVPDTHRGGFLGVENVLPQGIIIIITIVL